MTTETDATRKIVELLVRLTLNEDKLRELEREKRQARDAGKEADEVRRIVGDAFARWHDQYAGLSFDAIREIVSDYVDRSVSRVDGWDKPDRDHWIELCKTVTDVASSVV